ncbi:hypothetical protein GCM10011385_33360 [Nitratireductor aestuarii]|uniref:DUF112 domain-containing protein n=1 Tax=Nitratireductor aestuarii TaxID=1735103 RepID=A0A916RZ98_9HYPH|nr:hypothetical protein GCM10011385_33360 [Nitratireductor aestuarii]
MLAGIYYGAAYGGSTTAILVNLPGEASSVVTTIDGHQMAKQGRVGPALAAAAIGSFFAGCVGVLAMAIFSGPIAQVAFKFGPAEYFSLMLLGLVGMDVNSGVVRFSFGSTALWEGIDFIVITIGIFAFAEIVTTLERKSSSDAVVAPIKTLMPTRTDIRRMTPSILRGSALGSVLGILPGAGVSLACSLPTASKRKSRNTVTSSARAP